MTEVLACAEGVDTVSPVTPLDVKLPTQAALKKALRESKRLERSLAKVSKEIDLKQTKLLKQKQKARALDNKERLQNARRKWLPNEYQAFDGSRGAPTVLDPDCFVRVHDQAMHNLAVNALTAKRYDDVIQALAALFVCDGTQVCLIERRTITRKGVKCEVAYFRYRYNPMFNECLKSTGCAAFDNTLKSWNVVISEHAIALINNVIGQFFGVVIELDSMAIMQNSKEPCCKAPGPVDWAGIGNLLR